MRRFSCSCAPGHGMAGVYGDAWHRNLGRPGVKPDVGAVVAALDALVSPWHGQALCAGAL